MKVCTRCRTEKAATSDNFNRRCASTDGLDVACRDCRHLEKKTYYQRVKETPEYREKKRQAAYLTRYGITYVNKQSLLAAQGGVCAGCGKLGRIWHLDHDHKTGRIRGVLCSSCNHVLGFAKESIERLKGLIGYLKAEREVIFLPPVTI